MATFERTRPTVGAMAVGVARGAYEYARDYACEPEQFGRKIGEFQAVAFKLADMKARIDAARLLVYRAAWIARNGEEFESAEGSMAKLVASETAVHVTGGAIQILAATATPASTPSSACTATPRSSPSSRAPVRSSAWSWHAPSPACRSAEPANFHRVRRANTPPPSVLRARSAQARPVTMSTNSA